MPIGAHMTIGKGVNKALDDALSIGADTMQIFTRNPRGGKAKELSEEEIKLFRTRVEELNFGPWVAHAPYTVNLASVKTEVREFGIRTLKEDLKRVELLGGQYLVVHSGAHTGQGTEKGLELLAEALEEILSASTQRVSILLEGMSGSGSELGAKLEQLKWVLGKLDKPNLGVCLDTAHLFAAGYDVCRWDELWQRIEEIIGAEYIKAMHINDSAADLASHKDRHASLGEGMIGLQAFQKIVSHEKVRQLPLILETPSELAGWKKEIELLRKYQKSEGDLS